MDYVGIDHLIGLECRACSQTTPIPFSRLLRVALADTPIACGGCGRVTNHGWNSVEQARRLVAKQMSRSRKAPQLA